MDGWTDGRTDGRTCGWVDGSMDGRMEGWLCFQVRLCEYIGSRAAILLRVLVTKARVWIGESVYRIFTSRNYN
jgi:hypothetical protein